MLDVWHDSSEHRGSVKPDHRRIMWHVSVVSCPRLLLWHWSAHFTPISCELSISSCIYSVLLLPCSSMLDVSLMSQINFDAEHKSCVPSEPDHPLLSSANAINVLQSVVKRWTLVHWWEKPSLLRELDGRNLSPPLMPLTLQRVFFVIDGRGSNGDPY